MYIYPYLRKQSTDDIRTSMNERTHFFIKYISHTLFSKGLMFLCVREMSWKWGQTAILTPSSSSTIAALLSHLGWGSATVGHWGPKALNLPLALISVSSLQLIPTDLNRPGHLVILLSHVHLLPLFFRLFTQLHLLIGSSVEGQSITIRSLQ